MNLLFGRANSVGKAPLTATLTVCAALAVSGCQTGVSAINDVPGAAAVLGLQCVDATGPNSTREEIVNAQLQQELEDPETGATMSMLDLVTKQLEQQGTPQSAAEIRRSMIDEMYPIPQEGVAEPLTVPEGGDAAFAAAICGTPDGWLRVGLSGEEAQIAATPHLLRGAGRAICSTVSSSTSAEAVLKPKQERADRAAADPDAFKRDLIASIDQSITELSELEQTPAIAELIVRNKANRETLQSQPADAVAKGLELEIKIMSLAVEHQCPQTSLYGFGENCGKFNPFPDQGDGGGILRIKGPGTMSCEDASLIVRGDYFPSIEDPKSLLDDYYCKRGGFIEDEAAPIYIECMPMELGRPSVLVTPLE